MVANDMVANFPPDKMEEVYNETTTEKRCKKAKEILLNHLNNVQPFSLSPMISGYKIANSNPRYQD